MGRRDGFFIVITTFNRAAYLEGLLESVAALDPPPSAVVVVDNASTDGTAAVIENARQKLAALPRPVPLHLQTHERNVGGAGGFSSGMRRALAEGAAWMWLMDDDVTALPGAIGALGPWLDKYDAVVGRRYDANGEPFFWQHRFSEFLGVFLPVRGDIFADSNEFTTNVGCFEGMVVHADAVAAVGLPDPRFFITWDDAVYGWLISLDRPVVYVNEFVLNKAREQRSVDLGIRHLNDSSNLSRFHVMRNRGLVAQYLRAHGRFNRFGFGLGTFLTAGKELMRLVLVERSLHGVGRLWAGWRASRPIMADAGWLPMPPLDAPTRR